MSFDDTTRDDFEARFADTAIDLGSGSAEQYEDEAHQVSQSLMRAPDDGAATSHRPATRFGSVRIHADPQAAESARLLHARAYTVGDHIVFGGGNFAPSSVEGRRLIAHELTHVLQQRALQSTFPSTDAVEAPVMRAPNEIGDPLAAPRPDFHAPNAKTCTPPDECPKGFCQPYDSENVARYELRNDIGWLLAGIGIAVDSRVTPLWREHLTGGSAPKDLTPTFAKEFTESKTTTKATEYLVGELRTSVEASPPAFPPGADTVTIDVASRVSRAIAELDVPKGPHEMNFNIPKEVPGNIAGGVGKDQTTCKAGAKPSPFNDERQAKGTATITRQPTGLLSITPSITYTVKDTIDLCPGDCGTILEQFATVPISQFEATGIAGDVPFSVVFPANAPTFTIASGGPPALPPVVTPPTTKKGGTP